MIDFGTSQNRLNRKTEKSEGCWLWTGKVTKSGYGTIRVNKKIVTTAHRLAYMLAHGEISRDLDVDHLCRTRACVNPDHLEAVPHRENLMRGETWAAQNASKQACPSGHPLTGDNLRIDGSSRICKTCKYERNKEWRSVRKRVGGKWVLK